VGICRGFADIPFLYEEVSLLSILRTVTVLATIARFREVAAAFPQSELDADTELEIGYTYQRAERTSEAVTA
jgi:hypothetical protein